MEPLQQPQAQPPLETRETRDRLLEEAEPLFAERGFEATSVRDITAAAGANLAAVNYHFGGKDKLYREVFRRRLTALARQSTGSSTRLCRMILMTEPPSLDAGEATDKGSINQRAVLARRAALVEELYASAPSGNVIAIDRK